MNESSNPVQMESVMNSPKSLIETLVGSETAKAAADRPTRPKAIAWARVSTEMQEERGLSIPQQLRDIHAYAEKHGFVIVAEFKEAMSAYRREDKRVEFHRMIDRARSDREISTILVHDFSRFSRDSLRAKTLLRELRAAGIKVVSLNDPEVDPETAGGVYMEAITFAKNEAYSLEVAFHTRKGCRANVQTRDPDTRWCYKNGGQPLWGYRAQHVEVQTVRRDRSNSKTVWVLDDSLVAGRRMHEWVHHCLAGC